MVDFSNVVQYDQKENRITAQFIATLENSSREHVLVPFLNELGINDSGDVHFSLQVQENESRPDAEIIGDYFHILIEVKVSSKVTDEQLIRHYNGCKTRKSKIIILAITQDLEEPEGVKKARTALKEKNADVKWLGWNQIFKLIESIQTKLTDEKSIFLVNSLKNTLEQNELSGFTMFEENEFINIKNVYQSYASTLNKFNQFIKDLEFLLEKRKIKRCYFERSTLGNDLLGLINYITYGYNKSEWIPKTDGAFGSFITIGLTLDSASLMIGFVIKKDIIYSKDAKWYQFFDLLENEFDGMSIKKLGPPIEDVQELLSEIEDRKDAQTIESVFIYTDYNLELPEITTQISPQGIADSILERLNYLEKNNLFKLSTS